MSLTHSVLVLCLSLYFQGVLGSLGVCEEWDHHTFGRGLTCCHHKALTSGINEDTHFKECIKHPKNEKENYTTSMWRVYSCMLEKSLPKGQKTITLTKFSELMTAKYPDDIKKKINDKVAEVGKKEKTKKWLTTDIKLTDYENIDKFRADYFNIEKEICGGPKGVPKGEEKGKKFNECHYQEEMVHRDADCCGNTSLPFFDHHHDPFQDFKPKTCAKTLQKKLDKLGLKDKEDKETFVEECTYACYLIEKKKITIDDLLKIRVKDVIDTDKIVKEYVPVYLSEAVQKEMLKYVKDHFNRTMVMEDVPNTMLGDKANNEELYGCYAYAEIDQIAHTALFEMCHPYPHGNEDPDY